MATSTISARASLFAALLFTSSGGVLAAPEFSGQPSVGLATPAGWHRGSTVDLEIPGRGLFAPKDLLFYQDGIEVVSVKPLLDREMDDRERYNYRRKEEDRFRKRNKDKTKQFDPDAIDYPRREIEAGTRVVAKLKIKADAEPGEHVFRLVTGGGMGSLMTFWVGKFPTVTEAERPTKTEGNDTRDTAEPVALNHTVNGHIARYDKDVYKVSAKKGARVTFEVEAARLASYDRGDYLDVQLAVHDAEGKQIAAADDSALYLEDPYLSFKAPVDGDFFVTLEESVPSGSSNLLPYRLHVTGGTRPAMLYPAGGQPGETLNAKAILAEGETVAQTLNLPKSNGAATVLVAGDKNTPSGNPVRVFQGPNVLEEKPETRVAPVALNGILSKPGDSDSFTVTLEKDKDYTVRLFSSALGSPLDASMSIASAAKPNKKKSFNDCGEDELDRTMVNTHRDRLDPAGVFTPDADGDYVVKVEDSRGGGAYNGVYRVEIAEATDGIISYIVPPRNNEPRRGNRIQIAPGSRYSAVVALRNTFGSDAEGEFELVAQNLPKGVTLQAPRFSSASTRLPVVFECAKWVKPTALLVDLRAKPVGGKALPGGFRSTIPYNDVGGNNYMYYIYLDRLALSVTEAAPFKVIVEQPKAALTQDGELAIKVRLDRAPGFEAPVEINTEWLPPNAGRPSPVTLGPEDKSAEFVIGARRNTPPEDYRIAFVANSRNGDRRTGAGMVFGSSSFVTLKVAEPYLTAKMPRAAVEIGKTAQFVTKLEHLNDFKGKATVTLGRLPAGVEMVGGPLEIKPGQEEIKFTVRASESALTGSYRGMFCDLEFTSNGQTVSQRSGYGTLRIDSKRGAKKVAKR